MIDTEILEKFIASTFRKFRENLLYFRELSKKMEENLWECKILKIFFLTLFWNILVEISIKIYGKFREDSRKKFQEKILKKLKKCLLYL